METKTYRVGFFTGQIGPNAEGGHVSDLLKQISEQGRCPVKELRGRHFELRDLITQNRGHTFRGVLAKFRHDNIPHAGEPGGSEREIELDGNEGLIEKNHFIFHRQHELLVYQLNGNGSTINQLGEYLSDIVNDAVVFQPVLQLEPMRRLMRHGVVMRTLDLAFARPTQADWVPRGDWSRGAMELLSSADGAKIHVIISAKGRGKKRHFLSPELKQDISELMGGVDVSKALLTVEEDGPPHPIDLIADRLVTSVEVQMDGRYPLPASMYQALREARTQNADTLLEIFGAGHGALD